MYRTPAMSAAAPTPFADRILARASRPGGVSRAEVSWNLVDRKFRGDILGPRLGGR